MDILTQVIGYSAAVAGSTIMLPQVIHSIRTKSVEDISPTMLALYFLNCALWIAYGFLISDRPVLITNAVALVLVTVQLILKVRYRSNP